jgi:hypothetical protein
MEKKPCLNCGKELKQEKGKREKKFCNSTCRSAYWQKTHKDSKGKKYKLVPIEEYEKLTKPQEFMDKKVIVIEPKEEDIPNWKKAYNEYLKTKNNKK